MGRLNNNGVTINGHDQQRLQTQLESFYQHSAIARKLLDDAHDKTIELSAASGKPRIEGGVVHLFWQETHAAGSRECSSEELAESALFELKNLLNEGRFSTVSLVNNDYLAYGLKKATIEAESTVAIVSILDELQSSSLHYLPSDWGKKQIRELGGRTGPAAAEHVANTPHDSRQVDRFKLASKYLYTLERMEKSRFTPGGLRVYLGKIVEIRHGSGKAFSQAYKTSTMRSLFDTRFKTYGVSAIQLFVWIVRAIQSIEHTPGWTVTWQHGRTKDYADFADALIGVNLSPTVLPNTRRVDEIKTALMQAIG